MVADGGAVSTYLYLECRAHNPPLSSHGEVGQHLHDLPRIRREIAERNLFVALARADVDHTFDHHFTRNAARFFCQHPYCRIAIRDEYGMEHPISAEEAP